MKVVIAIDSLKGSLSSIEAGMAIKEGVLRAKPDARIVVKPLADGGEGTTDALIEGMNGERIDLTVTGPMHAPVNAYYGYLKDSNTAVMEMASAAGITLVPDDTKDPLLATSYGVGEMINHALQKGCRNFIIGIGGSATNDGGIGMLKALGARFFDENGMDAMAHFAQITSKTLGTDYCNTPGAGAAGGLGFAFLSYLGAALTPGIELILNAVGLEQELSDADVVVTGEGRLDFQTAMGKAPVGVAKLAKKHHAKVIAFAGSVTKEAAACNKEGIDAFFPILRNICTLAEAMDSATAKANMTATAEQVFRLL